MSEGVDLLDFKILESLGKYGPRNINRVARKLDIHPETLRKRINHLTSQFSLAFHANVYHTNLGLKKAVVVAEAILGYEELLFKCLMTNDFWLYVSPCYAGVECCFAIYAIPTNCSAEFEQFLHQLEKVGVARNVQLHWSTCWHTVNPTLVWLDDQNKTWSFYWDEWVEEVKTEGTRLPYTLKDPKDFPQKAADYTDVFILKEFDKDATISLSKIAKMLGLTRATVSYHYRQHVLKQGLIETSQVWFPRFDKAVSNFFIFIFRFDNEEKMARFTSSLLDKPFVHSLGKIIGENIMFAHIYLPRSGLLGFKERLSKLIRSGLLQNYSYLIEDFEKRLKQTISYEFFKDGSWAYDHNKHVQNLQDLVEATRQER